MFLSLPMEKVMCQPWYKADFEERPTPKEIWELADHVICLSQ